MNFQTKMSIWWHATVISKHFPSCKKAYLVVVQVGLFLSIISLKYEGRCPQKKQMGTIALLGTELEAQTLLLGAALQHAARRAGPHRPVHTCVVLFTSPAVLGGVKAACVIVLWALGESGSKTPQPVVEKEAVEQSERCRGCANLNKAESLPSGSENIKCVNMYNVLVQRAWSWSLKT